MPQVDTFTLGHSVRSPLVIDGSLGQWERDQFEPVDVIFFALV